MTCPSGSYATQGLLSDLRFIFQHVPLLKGVSMICLASDRQAMRLAAQLVPLLWTFVASTALAQQPPKLYDHCIEHADSDVKCLLFCPVCGHHGCSPDCPSKRENAPDYTPSDCDEAASAVEEARTVDLARQLHDQRREQIPWLKDPLAVSDDPERDYWSKSGVDPRRRTVSQQLSDGALFIRMLLGLEDGETPDTDEQPHAGRLPRVVTGLGWLTRLAEAIGEVQIGRARDYGEKLSSAEADLRSQVEDLRAKADRFEAIAQGCPNVAQSDAALLRAAGQSLRQQLVPLQTRLEAINRSFDAVQERLRRYQELQPMPVEAPTDHAPAHVASERTARRGGRGTVRRSFDPGPGTLGRRVEHETGSQLSLNCPLPAIHRTQPNNHL
jgi:hypothetical protein